MDTGASTCFFLEPSWESHHHHLDDQQPACSASHRIISHHIASYRTNLQEEEIHTRTQNSGLSPLPPVAEKPRAPSSDIASQAPSAFEAIEHNRQQPTPPNRRRLSARPDPNPPECLRKRSSRSPPSSPSQSNTIPGSVCFPIEPPTQLIHPSTPTNSLDQSHHKLTIVQLDPPKPPIPHRLPLRRQRRYPRPRVLQRLPLLHRILPLDLGALLLLARRAVGFLGFEQG